MNSLISSNTLRVLFATLVMLAAAPVLAEGTAQMGVNGRVTNTTALRIDVVNAQTERIAWTGQGNLTVRTPTGALVQTLNNNQRTGSLAATGAGAYQLTFGSNQTTANWDISIVDQNGAAIAGVGGRLFSTRWNLNLNGREAANALNNSFFALVNGGAPGNNAVIEVDNEGFNGNTCSILMNATGVDGRTDGRSAPAGSGATPQFPLYLNPPELRGNGEIGRAHV